MKKIIPILLCGVMFLCGGFALPNSIKVKTSNAAEVAPEKVKYVEDFSTTANGALPAGYAMATPAGYGTAMVTDGKLVIKGSNGAKRPVLKLPATLNDLENFTMEIDFIVNAPGDTSRYVGFMYRVTDVDVANGAFKYIHMAVRQNASDPASGVECMTDTMTASGADTWGAIKKTGYRENISISKVYTAKIVVNNKKITNSMYDSGNATEKIMVEDAPIPEGFDKGAFAIQVASNITTATISKISITEDELIKDDIVLYNEYADTYQEIATQLANPPTVATNITSTAELNGIGEGIRPATTILKLNATLNIVAADGSIIGTFDEVMSKIYMKVIPAFSISDMDTAKALAVRLRKSALSDCFVYSSDPALVKYVRSQCPLIRGIIAFNNDALNTPAKLLSVRDTVNTSDCKIALLPYDVATAEVVDYLQKRLITVWTIADTSDQVFSAISRGVNGIVSADFKNTYAAFTKFDKFTIARVPFIASHRGYSSKFPENTLKAAIESVKAGTDAVESDVYLSSDGVPVIHHDGSLQGTTTGTGHIENYTLEQIKKFKIKADTTLTIPTMEEFFNEFKDNQDIVHYVELKSTKADVVPAFKALVEKYKVSHQIVVIAFNESSLLKMRELMPEISVGYLMNEVGSAAAVSQKIAPFNATLNPYEPSIKSSTILTLKDRGVTIWGWTYSPVSYVDAIKYGCYGITTNYSDLATNMIETIVVKDKYDFYTDEKSSMPIKATVTTKGGETLEVDCTYKIIEGTLKLSKNSDGTYFGYREVSAKAILFAEYVSGGKSIYLLSSQPTIFNVIDGSQPIVPPVEPPVDPNPPVDPTEPTDPEKNGCSSVVRMDNNSFGGGLMTFGVIALVAVSGIAVAKRRKTK